MAEEGSGDDERCGAILDGEKAKAVVVAAHNMSRYDDAVFMLLVVYWCLALVVVAGRQSSIFVGWRWDEDEEVL